VDQPEVVEVETEVVGRHPQHGHRAQQIDAV
jgi:hypothetical protein